MLAAMEQHAQLAQLDTLIAPAVPAKLDIISQPPVPSLAAHALRLVPTVTLVVIAQPARLVPLATPLPLALPARLDTTPQLQVHSSAAPAVQQ
jgi:hypothetical protein